MVSHLTPKCFSIKRSSWSTQWPQVHHHQPTTTVSDSWYEVFVLICCIIFSVLVFSFFILLQRLVLIKTPTSYYHPYYTKVHFLWSNENFTFEIYNYRTVSTRIYQNVFCNVYHVVSVKMSVFIEVIPMKAVKMYFTCTSTSAFWLNSC